MNTISRFIISSLIVGATCTNIFAQQKGQSLTSKPVASFNLYKAENLSNQKYANQLQLAEKMGGRVLTSIERTQLRDSLIDGMILAQAAEKEKITYDDNEVLSALRNMANKPDGTLQQIQGIYESGEMAKLQSWNDYLAEVRQQSANSKYIRKKVGEVPPPSDAEVRAFFEENKNQFFVPTTVRVSHIFFDYKNLDDAKRKEKLQKAKAVLAEIDSGKVTFEEQVRKNSEDQASSNRLGDIGPIPDTPQVRQYLGDEFMNAMLSLRSGQISRVVASKEGYHILKVTERAEGKKLKLEDPNPSDPRQTVYQLVQYQVMNVSYQKKAETIVKDLRTKANIKINEEIWSTWVTTNNTNVKAGS